MLLEIGDHIRYKGLGAGQIVRHEERDFKGQKRIFAVINFPHHAMLVQLPVGDPVVAKKLNKIVSKAESRKLLTLLRKPGKSLSRT